ncbi:MAG: hypothetical protein JO257_16595 [Deltaproteobacteria bacterium]|nr:hypothetical protein [Deltaproteobacteria bacterium]
MIRAVAALAAVALAVWACSVDRKTPALACKTTADCTGRRTCQSGYCVTDGPVDAKQSDAKQIDAAVCPPACASCDFPTGTCNLTGAGSGSAIACPATWSCVITCNNTAPCGNIACGGASACKVTCSGSGACGTLTCGTGKCTQDCEGSGACGATMCASSCRCDVTCNPLVGACGTMTCPMQGNRKCTQNMVPGFPCDSTVAPQCHSCP